VQPESVGWQELTEQVAAHIKFMQSVLNEVRFYRDRAADSDDVLHLSSSEITPDLGEDPESVQFEMPDIQYPPEWLGWAIILFLLFGLYKGLQEAPALVRPYRNARPANERPAEYRRELPPIPPPDTAIVWPPEE
jgi:hypothetical protein